MQINLFTYFLWCNKNGKKKNKNINNSSIVLSQPSLDEAKFIGDLYYVVCLCFCMNTLVFTSSVDDCCLNLILQSLFYSTVVLIYIYIYSCCIFLIFVLFFNNFVDVSQLVSAQCCQVNSIAIVSCSLRWEIWTHAVFS